MLTPNSKALTRKQTKPKPPRTSNYSGSTVQQQTERSTTTRFISKSPCKLRAMVKRSIRFTVPVSSDRDLSVKSPENDDEQVIGTGWAKVSSLGFIV